MQCSLNCKSQWKIYHRFEWPTIPFWSKNFVKFPLWSNIFLCSPKNYAAWNCIKTVQGSRKCIAYAKKSVHPQVEWCWKYLPKVVETFSKYSGFNSTQQYLQIFSASQLLNGWSKWMFLEVPIFYRSMYFCVCYLHTFSAILKCGATINFFQVFFTTLL